MIYTVNGYVGTGFDAVNQPYSAGDLLDTGTARLFDTVDLVQPFGLASIKLKAALEEVEDLDFIKIEGEIYSCGSPTMLAEDVAMIPLEHRGALSVGGFANPSIKITGGLVSRRSIKASENVFGKFAAADPLLSNASPLEIVDAGVKFSDDGVPRTVIVEATIDLYRMGLTEAEGGQLSDTYGEGENAVSVPHVEQLHAYTEPSMQYPVSGDPSVVTRIIKTPVTGYFDAKDPHVIAGIARSRQCGVSEAVLNQYTVPENFAKAVVDTENPGMFSSVSGVIQVSNLPELPFDFAKDLYDYQVENQRVLYGDDCRYVLCSMASGSSIAFNPEDILNGEASPVLVAIADPRSTGCPMFRFLNYRFSASWFANALIGAQWQTAPLAYTGAEGSAVAYQRTQTRLEGIQQGAETNFLQTMARAVGSAASLGTGLAGTFGGAENKIGGLMGLNLNTTNGQLSLLRKAGLSTFDASGVNYWQMRNDMIGGIEANRDYQMANQAMGGVGGLISNGLSLYSNYQQQALAQRELLENYALQTKVVAPNINFPMSGTIRDFVSNGVLVFRYVPAKEDVIRKDKLLTYFGTRIGNEQLEPSMLTGKKYFNYISAAGVTIGGNLPRWRRDEIAAELETGVRLWHSSPTNWDKSMGNPDKEDT